jgi:hypothetical protein
MLLSDKALPPGTYQISILLKDQVGKNDPALVKTGSSIKKTPNTIQYMAEP